MPLRSIKVLEFTGLAPVPFCGKILADFGAKVTRIDRVPENELDVLQAGKSTLAIDLKHAKGQDLVKKLASRYDVLIEPFRPGVMERLNLGPDVLCKANGRLIYARLTGFGQSGILSKRAGHDINYTAISGVLSMLGRKYERPEAPINIMADFAGGGLMCALGICLALLERTNSGCGQVVDAAMIDGAAYVASWLFNSRNLPIWTGERGTNLLDGGAFYYDTYETKDGGFMSVGALEPQFFDEFKKLINLPHLTQFASSQEENENMREAVRSTFLQKTRAEWSEIFENVDACVYPVLDWHNVMQHKHHKERKSFTSSSDGLPIPNPAPKLSRTPGSLKSAHEDLNEILQELRELQITKTDLQQLIDDKIIQLPQKTAKL